MSLCRGWTEAVELLLKRAATLQSELQMNVGCDRLCGREELGIVADCLKIHVANVIVVNFEHTGRKLDGPVKNLPFTKDIHSSRHHSDWKSSCSLQPQNQYTKTRSIINEDK